MINRVILKKSIYDEMISYSQKCAPEEACGILFGVIDDNNDCVVAKCVMITNIEHSHMHYTMDQSEQMAANRLARKEGLKKVIIFHSHPKGPDRITREDVKLAIDTSIIWIVVSFVDNEFPDLKAFVIQDEESKSIQIDMI